MWWNLEMVITVTKQGWFSKIKVWSSIFLNQLHFASIYFPLRYVPIFILKSGDTVSSKFFCVASCSVHLIVFWPTDILPSPGWYARWGQWHQWLNLPLSGPRWHHHKSAAPPGSFLWGSNPPLLAQSRGSWRAATMLCCCLERRITPLCQWGRAQSFCCLNVTVRYEGRKKYKKGFPQSMKILHKFIAMCLQ